MQLQRLEICIGAGYLMAPDPFCYASIQNNALSFSLSAAFDGTEAVKLLFWCNFFSFRPLKDIILRFDS